MDPALLELIEAGSPGDEVAVIVRLREGASPPPDLRLVARFGPIATGRAMRGRLAAIHDHPAVLSEKAPRVYSAEPAPAPDEPGLSEADPTPAPGDDRRPEGLLETGAGTIVAAIDWGLDFAHPDFRDDDGKTRLIALWDQRVRGVPSTYGYGAIHSRDVIDRALGQADPFEALGYRPATTPAPAHGTHVMGIAAGNGKAGGPCGVAPEADLIFVHLGPGTGDLGNSIDLLEAVHFVVATAGTRPVAINMSIGRHAGPHNGTLLIEQAIDWLVLNRPGTVVVQSTGNYYSRSVHMEGRLRETRTAVLPFVVPARGGQPAMVEFWYNAPDTFTARARAPDGSTVCVDRGENKPVVDRSGRELARLYHRGFDPNNGDHLISLALKPDAPTGEWVLEATGIDVVDGRWHAWIERNAACPQCQGQFAADRASGASTTGSISNALRTIAVGAYDAHSPEPRLAKFSSVGPTRDGRPKPLLVAPGVRVLSVQSRVDAREPPGYVRMSGTSMAAPHVTGTAALMLEAAGIHPIAALRGVLFASLTPAPDRDPRWGYGLLDVAAAVEGARRLRAGRQPEALPIEQAEAARGPPRVPAIPQLTEDVAMTDYREDLEASDPFEETDPPGEPPRERKWTKGRNQRLPTPEERVLAEFSDDELREMLGEEPPRVAVASREDVEATVARALDPADPGTTVIGWPGRRLDIPLSPGDLIVHRGLGGTSRAAMITNSQLLDRRAARALGGDAPAAGRYAAIAGQKLVQRLTGPDGLILPETLILRSAGEDFETPPSAPKPTVRQGSRGAAVTEAQTRLNAVHARRIAAGQPGLDRCPLVADGVFGANTRAATVAFQRTAFPSSPREWDGVIGSRTWAALIDAGGEGQSLPARCTRLDRETVIDEFEFGKADVLPRHQPLIVGIARCVVESEKSSTPVRRLRCVGHTDPVGSDSDNVSLGLRRAEAIRDEILKTIRRMTSRAPSVAIEVDSRGEREARGTPGESRRVVVESDFVFVPGKVPPPPKAAATVAFVLDDNDDHVVDGGAPVATALMFGLWDSAYHPSGHPSAGDVRNGASEADNFVGDDHRRFYLRVNDPGATGTTVTARWRTVTAAGANDDAPASQAVTLTETSSGSKIFVSRALMLVSDDVDARQPTHSGFTTGADAGLRNRGQSNHRLRRAALDGSVVAEYTPAGGGSGVTVTLPVFQRSPDLRRRLNVRVVFYGLTGLQRLIAVATLFLQFRNANNRWAQVGLRIDSGDIVDRPIPAGAQDSNGNYDGLGGNAAEHVALDDLIPLTPDNTVTLVYTRMPSVRDDGQDAVNAYATLFHRTRTGTHPPLDDRYFIFQHFAVPLENQTLPHELHHVLFNRGDTDVERRFFTFNTNPPDSFGVPLPDVRIYRRIQMLHSADPNSDPPNDNILNWVRRRRTQRFNQPGNRLPAPLDAPDATTGNILVGSF